MKTKMLMLSAGIFFFVSANPQAVSIPKCCLFGDCICIDTCIRENDTLYVIHYSNYLIHARSNELGTDHTQLKVIAIFQRTQYPILGYCQIMQPEYISNIVKKIRTDYRDNEARITQKKKNKRKDNSEVQLAHE